MVKVRVGVVLRRRELQDLRAAALSPANEAVEGRGM
jgi:hypothetical protein